MGLPTSREETAAPNAPVKSATVNALQDAVVGAKHPPLPFAYGASGFQQKNGAANGLLGLGFWTFNAGTTELMARVHAPVGSRIHQIEWGFNRGGAGVMTPTLKKFNLRTGPAAATIANSGVAIAAGTGWTSQIATPDYVVEDGYALFLDMIATDVANQFGGAIVTIDRL